MSNSPSDEVLDAVTRFFLESRDFNGIPFHDLVEETGLTPEKVASCLKPLVEKELAGVIHRDDFINPHIIRTGFAPTEHQLEKLDPDSLSGACIYPRQRHLEEKVDPSGYSRQPYTFRLALGEPHLAYRSFELSVLEHYRNDPRYYYRNDDVNGSISVRDEPYEEGSMRESDEVLLKFGFSYDDNPRRAVAVFLTELDGLSAEHQQIWKAKELEGDYKLHPDFYRNMVLGEWGEKVPIFDAFLEEMELINRAAELMDRPPLFREEYRTSEHEKPREFGFLVRPTSKEYYGFVHLLDKMLSENLNKDFFKGDVSDRYEDGSRKGTINMLDEWVRSVFDTENWEPWDRAIESIKEVRNQRQKPAHAVVENEFDQKYLEKQRRLVEEAYDAVRVLRQVLEHHPSVTEDALDVPDYLREGRIWTV